MVSDVSTIDCTASVQLNMVLNLIATRGRVNPIVYSRVTRNTVSMTHYTTINRLRVLFLPGTPLIGMLVS